jgi:hypothetical protein
MKSFLRSLYSMPNSSRNTLKRLAEKSKPFEESLRMTREINSTGNDIDSKVAKIVNRPSLSDEELQEMAKSYGNLPNNRTNGQTFEQQMEEIKTRMQTTDHELPVLQGELQELEKQLEIRQNNLRKEQLKFCEKNSSSSFCPKLCEVNSSSSFCPKLCEVNSSHSFCPKLTMPATGGARKSRKHKRTRKHMRKHTRKHKVMKSKMTKSKSKKVMQKGGTIHETHTKKIKKELERLKEQKVATREIEVGKLRERRLVTQRKLVTRRKKK